MGVVVRRYIAILTIIINFPYSTCIIALFLAAASLLLCSFFKCFFSLYYIYRAVSIIEDATYLRNKPYTIPLTLLFLIMLTIFIIHYLLMTFYLYS